MAHGAAAMQAGNRAAACIQQAQVIVDFSGRGDGGAWVARLVLLLDGDGRGEAVHVVDIRLLDALQELPRVGGQAFHVAALAFGVDGIERQRRLARARNAAHHRQRVVRDVDVDVLEIVRARAANDDVVVSGDVPWSHYRASCFCGSLSFIRSISSSSRHAPTTMAESATLKSGQ